MAFWKPFFLGAISLVLVGSLLGLVIGWRWGMGFTAAGFCFIAAWQTRHLVKLWRWLKAPDNEPFPDAGGAWGHVFVELARRLRWDERARAEMRAELDIFREAGAALPDGVVMLDEHNRIVWCNQTAEKHLGIHAQGDIGLVVTQLVRVPGFAEYLTMAEAGEAFNFTPQDAPLQTIALEVIRYGVNRKLIVSFDITQIERAETIRRDFIANVSHELRTPLTVVNGFIEHLQDDPGMDTEQRQRFVELMSDQSRRMLRLVDDLLTLSRLEAKSNLPREEEIDVATLSSGLVEQGRALSGGRHELILTCAGGVIKGSRSELESAFGNLISNAVRYTPEGGRIEISWSIHEGRGVYTVADNGMGIALEHLPRLTERFYRVDKGRSRDTGGTGLGLAIVKHVLLRHQAELRIESELGKGSRFSAIFPAWRITTP